MTGGRRADGHVRYLLDRAGQYACIGRRRPAHPGCQRGERRGEPEPATVPTPGLPTPRRLHDSGPDPDRGGLPPERRQRRGFPGQIVGSGRARQRGEHERQIMYLRRRPGGQWALLQ
jgi:hypothetical protein